MRYGKQGKPDDRSVIICNGSNILSGISATAACDYRIGQYPPLRWLSERYQVKTGPAGAIVNASNDRCAEQGHPRCIINLMKRATAVKGSMPIRTPRTRRRRATSTTLPR